MKNLPIDYYIDGFNVEDINCWDMTLATASAAYKNENYYFYSLLYAVYMNWPDNDEQVTTKILSILGLKLTEYPIHSEEELIHHVCHSIDTRCPALLLLRYNTMFFNSLYKTDSDLNHLLLILGYDQDTGLLNIRDYLFARNFIRTAIPGNADVFVDFRIKYEHLMEMWRETRKQGVEGFYSLEKVSDALIEDYEGLVQYYLDHVVVSRNDYERYNEAKSGDYKQVRQKMYHSVAMMLRVIERAFDTQHCLLNRNDRAYLKQQLEFYIKNRNMYANKVIKELMREGKISQGSIDCIVNNDQEIYEFISDIFERAQFVHASDKRTERNLSYNATVLCDSEVQGWPGANAVNGITDSDRDCWCSGNEAPQHWLIVDLKMKKQANRFVVLHHPYKRKLVTRDFSIEGSNDMNDWDVLAVVHDNEQHSSVVETASAMYRYYKLNIMKSSSIDENVARILSFEIYQV
ncbi:MAG: discoidin domain-containing protein [Lachnospiraceae bacterium]